MAWRIQWWGLEVLTLVQERYGPNSVIVIQIFIDMETERYHKTGNVRENFDMCVDQVAAKLY